MNLIKGQTMTKQWTVQDEINLCKWVEDKGFKMVYLPEVEQWGYYHVSNKHEINGVFSRLVDLKQHFVKLKGDQNVCIVLSKEDYQKVAQAGGVHKLH